MMVRSLDRVKVDSLSLFHSAWGLSWKIKSLGLESSEGLLIAGSCDKLLAWRLSFSPGVTLYVVSPCEPVWLATAWWLGSHRDWRQREREGREKLRARKSRARKSRAHLLIKVLLSHCKKKMEDGIYIGATILGKYTPPQKRDRYTQHFCSPLLRLLNVRFKL